MRVVTPPQVTLWYQNRHFECLTCKAVFATAENYAPILHGPSVMQLSCQFCETVTYFGTNLQDWQEEALIRYAAMKNRVDVPRASYRSWNTIILRKFGTAATFYVPQITWLSKIGIHRERNDYD